MRFDAESYGIGDEMSEETIRTPSFIRGNKFCIPLIDSASTTPRWAIRCPKKSAFDRGHEFAAEEGGGGGTGDQSAPGEPEGGDSRQVRLDRKSLMELYMELDEERSASAVAANNAMAMITRLQADKAAVQMEALQYQRMMEEQAEYDEEAIQLLRDELKKKDRQVKYLENEIEAYRIRYGDIMEDGFMLEEIDDDGEYQEMEESEPGMMPSYNGQEMNNINGGENSGKNELVSQRRNSSRREEKADVFFTL